MIPWRISFSGIRDYRPERIDLSGLDEHIMITGPNGSGKSTITYCMGAVLYSSKVDVEGLKSRNLLPDQVWNAQISFVFKNEGHMKIDAATFIQFSLRLVQEPGQPVKKEFSISTGEEIDQWENTTKYTSGDRQFNFTAYKQDLLYKYKIEPDAYYLIWYQQEVNQFAVMNPEERFRIFSEMHGIDQAQREWEESIEKLKETTETLGTAKYSVQNKNLELQIAKGQLDRFRDNQKRLHDGARKYLSSLLQLETALKKEMKRLDGTIEELAYHMDDVKSEISAKQVKKEQIESERKNSILTMEERTKQLEEAERLLETLTAEIEHKRQLMNELEKELEYLTKRKNQITRTEKEVQEGLVQLKNDIVSTDSQLVKVEDDYNLYGKKQLALLNEIAALNYQVKEDERLALEHHKRLAEYGTSHEVSTTIDQLEEEIVTFKNEHFALSNDLQELERERDSLLENRDLSKRQSESLAYFRSRQIKAYTLHELVELDEQAQLKHEGLFHAIKYTIFFQGKYIEPPNDLYHVPLMETVPDRFVDKIPELHLKIKEDIKEDDLPHAMKALWWVGQFFENGPFRILNGCLHDEMGIRGPQEKERYILSKKALFARKQEVDNLITSKGSRLEELEGNIRGNTKKAQELNRIIQYVREAEAFMATEYERKSRVKRLAEERKNLTEVETTLGELESEKTNLHVQLIHLGSEREKLEEEAIFYKELGRMKGKYDHLLQLQTQYTSLKEQQNEQVTRIENVDQELHTVENKIKKLQRSAAQFEEEIELSQIGLTRTKNQLNNKKDEKESTSRQLVNFLQEIEEMKNLVPQLYAEVASESLPEQLASLISLKSQRENGQIKFDSARREPDIDPAAPENYEAVKQEFERLDNEYKRTNILLEQDRERAEQLKDKLETTINMRVTEIRGRFQSYMSHFQFEGEVTWESFEDKKGRTHFKLYIKARKEGHRGTMEDVSTKARGGKVGKGVSGGEESLSSLLFALALLQNLSFKPGFIVLDEFDSALDEGRKLKVFDLYVQELKRKLIILTPKSHEEQYLKRFSKALVVQHDPTIPSSKIVGIVKKG